MELSHQVTIVTNLLLPLNFPLLLFQHRKHVEAAILHPH